MFFFWGGGRFFCWGNLFYEDAFFVENWSFREFMFIPRVWLIVPCHTFGSNSVKFGGWKVKFCDSKDLGGGRDQVSARWGRRIWRIPQGYLRVNVGKYTLHDLTWMIWEARWMDVSGCLLCVKVKFYWFQQEHDMCGTFVSNSLPSKKDGREARGNKNHRENAGTLGKVP